MSGEAGNLIKARKRADIWKKGEQKNADIMVYY